MYICALEMVQRTMWFYLQENWNGYSRQNDDIYFQEMII